MKTMMWLVIFLVVLVSNIDVQAQVDSSKASDDAPVSPQGLEMNNAIDLGDGLSLMPTVMPTAKKVENQCDVRAVFPQFKGPLTAAMQRFNELVKKQLDEESEPWHGGCAENDYFQSDYLVYHVDRRLVSVLFKDSFLAGGPHPAQTERVVNYDLTTGKELMLADLFKRDSNYLKLFSDYALFKIIRDEIFADKQCEQARGITFPTDANYQYWLLNSNGVSVHFEHTKTFPYSVYWEDIVAEIPFSSLKDMIRTDGPAAYLLPKDTEGTLTLRPVGTKARRYDELEDGQYYAFIKQISFCEVPEGEITFDMVEFLMGDAAVKAAKEEGFIPKDADSIDNDYYVRNSNPKLRTLAMSEKPELKLLNVEGDLWQFAGYINGTWVQAGSDQHDVSHDLFILTIKKGKVVKIETQYLP